MSRDEEQILRELKFARDDEKWASDKAHSSANSGQTLKVRPFEK